MQKGSQEVRQACIKSGRQKVSQAVTQTRVPIKLGLVDGND